MITTLGAREGLSQRELAAVLEIEAPTLKRQLDGLEADGFIERRPVEGDARKNGIHLAQKAHDSRIAALGRRLRSDALEGISADDLARARTVLDAIARNIEQMRQK